MSEGERVAIIVGAFNLAGIILALLSHRNNSKDIRQIKHQTNSLVDKLLTDAEKKGDKAGYDRAQQEQKDLK